MMPFVSIFCFFGQALIRQTYEAFEIVILKGVVSVDHLHILVSAPPNHLIWRQAK